MQERQPEWMTTADAAAYVKVHPETIRKWAREQALPATKLGNRGGFRFRRVDVDRFMESRSERELVKEYYFAIGRGVYHLSEKCAGVDAFSGTGDPEKDYLTPCRRCVRE